MLQVKALRTFALNAKDLGQAERFYTQVLGAEVIKRIDPTEEESKRGRVREVDVKLGNFQVHIFDASDGPRRVPHHTIVVPWQEKAKLTLELNQAGAAIENSRDHPDGKGYSLYVRDPDGNMWEIWSA